MLGRLGQIFEKKNPKSKKKKKKIAQKKKKIAREKKKGVCARNVG
jgi:hypothetical protein